MTSKHHKSVFDSEQELLKALIHIHLDGKEIECDPMFFKGNFYKEGINTPKYIFDINPQVLWCEVGDATQLSMIKDNTLSNMILDPPFLFGVHGNSGQYYTSRTMGIYHNFTELETAYKAILKEAHRILKKKGILIFKCQDYTDSKTTMTHVLIYNWAIDLGFYAKDMAILVKPNKIYNSHTIQRHLRKIHTYFWVFVNNT